MFFTFFYEISGMSLLRYMESTGNILSKGFTFSDATDPKYDRPFVRDPCLKYIVEDWVVLT